MALATTLAIAALVGSIVCLDSESRAIALLAVIASGIEVAVALDVLRLSIAGVQLPTVLGAILAAAGLFLLTKVNRKMSIVAATVVALVGCLQVLVSLRLVHG